jgi:transglutaminase-like putative cysteine protease
MIVRIELNQLEKRSNDYFYNDTPFNGEAYDHRDNQLYQVYEITDGVITGSRDYGFFEANDQPKVDYLNAFEACANFSGILVPPIKVRTGRKGK